MNNHDEWDEPAVGFQIIEKTTGFLTKLEQVIIFIIFSVFAGVLIFL